MQAREVFAKRLKQLREMRGLSMKALGEAIGVSANMVKKYEHGQSMPSGQTLARLANALDVTLEQLFRPFVYTFEGARFRKRANLSAKAFRRIQGELADQIERWMMLRTWWPGEFPLAPFAEVGGLPERIDSLEDIEQVADTVRRAWALGTNPIPDLTDTLEMQGILVVQTRMDADGRFDGLQAWADDYPVVAVSALWPGDRQRFTLAHELGHLLLDTRLDGVDMEQTANRFAGAFLLPRDELVRHLGEKRAHIEPRELYLLKREFGLSMAAVAYRAKDTGIIDQTAFARLMRLFRANGWHRQEPGTPCQPEQPRLFEQLVFRLLADGGISPSKAAELLGIDAHRLEQLRQLGAAETDCGGE